MNLKSIKTKAIIALVLSVLALMPLVGVVFTIASYAVMFFAVRGVKELSQSTTLLRNFSIFVGLMVAAVILEKISSGTLLSILKFVVVVAGVVYGFFYYKEMSRLSDINLFFIAYIFVLIDSALSAFWLGWIAWVFALLAFLFELIAWIKLEHINKATL